MDYIILCVLGLLLGVALNIHIYRIPWGELPFTFPPSHCPTYRRQLIYADIIGLLASAFVPVLFYQYGFSIESGMDAILIGTLLTAALIDFKSKIIPDSINIFAAMTGITGLFLGCTVSVPEGLMGIAAGGGSLYLIGLISGWILKKEGMGGGDIKLAAACGLYLGLEKMTLALIVTAYLAGFILLALLLLKRIRKEQYVPFAPFLSAGVITVILFSNIFFT